jgi:type I restriction enzyme S subunit
VTRAKWFVAEIQRRSVGVSYPAINGDDIGDILCPVPPLEEQRRITELLDAEIRSLNSSIWRLRRLRALSEERMVAYRSFRLGCDRPLRSGFDLPPGWRLTRLKFLARLQTGVTLGKDYGEAALVECPYLRVANVLDGRVDLDDVRSIKVPAQETARYELRAGDVLMTEGGDNDKLGRGTVWGGEIPSCLHQNHVFAVRVDSARLRPEFLAAVMSSTHGKAYFQSTAHQTTNLASTNSAKLMNLPIPSPPLREQDRLLQEFAKKGRLTERLNQALSRHQGVLTEHRDALITAAVTGQLDPTSYRRSAVAT